MSQENSTPRISELLRKRRSVRRFLPSPVGPEKLLALLEAARIAPSACNRQDWHFVVVEDAGTRAALVRTAGASRLLGEAPAVVFCLYRDDNRAEAYQSSSAAIENMLIEAANQGLGALWLNAFGDQRTCGEILGVPPGYFITSAVLVGQAAGDGPAPARKTLEEISHWGRFTGSTPLPLSHDPDHWTLDAIRAHQRLECGKTRPGTLQDVFSPLEISAARSLFPPGAGNCLDLFPFDGHAALSFFREGPARLTFLDLCPETSRYSRETLAGSFPDASFLTFDGIGEVPEGAFDAATLLFRIERIPERDYARVFSVARRALRPGGTLLVAFRPRPSLHGAMHRMLVTFRGDNIRRTAVFAFFGPYRPVPPETVERYGREAGFRVEVHRRFTLPPLLPEFIRLLRRYRRSGGRTYLHGAQEESRLAAALERLLEKGIRRGKRGGSLAVAILTKL